jgi:hypothetical protein
LYNIKTSFQNSADAAVLAAASSNIENNNELDDLAGHPQKRSGLRAFGLLFSF